MNEETTQEKHIYTPSENNVDNNINQDVPEGWEEIGPAPPDPDNYSLILQQIKLEFAITAVWLITNTPRIIDIPTATDDAVELKRRGEFIKANRFYADYLRDNELLSPMMAMAWFKCLAASGDTGDAFFIAEYLMSHNPPDCYATNMLRQHMQTLHQLIDMGDKGKLLNFLAQLSGNPFYYLIMSDIDVLVDANDSEVQEEREKTDDYGAALRHHLRDVEDGLLHEDAVLKILDGTQYKITPVHRCRLYSDPNQNFGFFIVGARLEFNSFVIHLCLEENKENNLSMFWVGPFGRLDNAPFEPVLYNSLDQMVPDIGQWLLKYINQ